MRDAMNKAIIILKDIG